MTPDKHVYKNTLKTFDVFPSPQRLWYRDDCGRCTAFQAGLYFKHIYFLAQGHVLCAVIQVELCMTTMVPQHAVLNPTGHATLTAAR